MKKEILEKLAIITEEEQKFLDGEKNIDRNIYMTNENNIINSNKLLNQDKQITVRPHTRFVHFPEHTHDYVEAIYMCSGQTTHIINGEKIVLKEGNLLFLMQNTRQEILPAGINDIAVNFLIMPHFFEQTLLMLGDEESPIKNFLIDAFTNKRNSTGYLHFEVADVLPIQNTIETFVWALLNSVPNKRKINQTTMGFLFLLLMNYTDRITHKNKEEELIIKTLSYIEENYIYGSLKNLADNLHYDFAWLSREIKRRTGKTYTELLQEKRLAQSCWLLKNTSLNIDEIAHRIGYENVSYFHRVFNKKYHQSPKKFRMCSL